MGVAVGHTPTSSGPCSLPVIGVEPGKKYRFRFVGGTGLSHIIAKFEGHENLTVVQVDGSEWTKTAYADRLQIAVGQRFDVIFQAKALEELDVKMDYYFQFENWDRPILYRGYGVLRYSRLAPPPPVPLTPPFNLTNTT